MQGDCLPIALASEQLDRSNLTESKFQDMQTNVHSVPTISNPIKTNNQVSHSMEVFLELKALRQRDFKTRLFMSSDDGILLRTFHTDDTPTYEGLPKTLAHVKDYFEAAYCTKDHVVAKATLTKLLHKLYSFPVDEYAAFTTIVASSLSDQGKNTSFEINPALVKDKGDLRFARRRFIV